MMMNNTLIYVWFVVIVKEVLVDLGRGGWSTGSPMGFRSLAAPCNGLGRGNGDAYACIGGWDEVVVIVLGKEKA